MGLSALLFSNPLAFFALTIPLLYSIILHEIAHGWVAYLFGDDTAMRSGRLSLNPLTHLDPLGTLLLFIAGFGWAKPVPVDYSRLRNFRVGIICVSMAGCVINIIIATISIMALQLPGVTEHQFISSILLIIAKINVILGALNLIPIPPLDGSRILLGILPKRAQTALLLIEPYGLLILFGLLFTGLLNPVIMSVQGLIVAFIKLILRI